MTVSGMAGLVAAPVAVAVSCGRVARTRVGRRGSVAASSRMPCRRSAAYAKNLPEHHVRGGGAAAHGLLVVLQGPDPRERIAAGAGVELDGCSGAFRFGEVRADGDQPANARLRVPAEQGHHVGVQVRVLRGGPAQNGLGAVILGQLMGEHARTGSTFYPWTSPRIPVGPSSGREAAPDPTAPPAALWSNRGPRMGDPAVTG